ncbi:MAG: hypothetical protein HUU02_11620 [Bacteroidetes bacterium]|nr:hypothetical protein [Bacteroidota bacterium]
MKKLLILCFLALCIGTVPSIAQYKKKVVSFVDHVAAGSSVRLTKQQSEHLAAMFAKSVTMERFNYTSLPSSVVADFIAATAGMGSVSAEEVRGAIERTLAPKFLELLDINKEMLSKQNLTEAERNTFLATKAQSAGLSAAQLEAILNSGFFYVPYVEYFNHSVSTGERDVKNDQGKVVRTVPTVTHTHTMKAGLLWFQLTVDRSNTAGVRYIGTAKGWKGSAIDRSETRDLSASEGLEWETFTQAVSVSAVNVGNETKKLPEFQLSGTVTETTTFGVRLSLGSREGVGLDDSYWIEEEEETESGEIVRSRRGFVKVREVGDNKKDEGATSYAQTITGLNYSPGLSVTEIPMIGVNAVFGLGMLPVTISPFDNTAGRFGLEDFDFAATVTAEAKNAFGPFLWLQANIANNTKVSELWFHAGASIGLMPVEGKFYLPNYNSSKQVIGGPFRESIDLGPAFTGYINVGMVKKFYFRRFGLVLQGDVKYWMTEFTGTGKDFSGDQLDYSLLNDNLGFDGKAGLEFYITPMLSAGLGAEYNIFAKDNVWTATVTDKDKNEYKKSDAVGPDTQTSGLAFYLWVNYALPSLF